MLRLACLVAVMLAAAPVAAAETDTTAIPASDLLIRATSPTLRFVWRAPPDAATDPILIRLLRDKGERALTEARTEAAADATDASGSGRPFHPHDHRHDWTVFDETTRFLVLRADIASYTGGAHGQQRFDAVLWDKRRSRAAAFQDLFIDWSAVERRLRPDFCAALDAERERRLDPLTIDQHRANMPRQHTECPVIAAALILPFCDEFAEGPIEGIAVLLPPYVAGSYAEGPFEITIRPEWLRAAARPEYRNAFAPSSEP